jgi:hypothetical protein
MRVAEEALITRKRSGWNIYKTLLRVQLLRDRVVYRELTVEGMPSIQLNGLTVQRALPGRGCDLERAC